VASTGRVRSLEGALDDYLRAISSHFRADLSGRRVLLDCANGAMHRAAPVAFERAGARVEVIGDEPDGRNINEECGSTHLEVLVEAMAGTDAVLGFAFDGDGDRVLAADAEGRTYDGDELLAISAKHLMAEGRLPGPGVAVTVMSNYGFHRAMAALGIEVDTTPVGDRHVIDSLLRRGWELGGEQSGHLIATDFAPTGDGLAAALLAMEALGDRTLAEAAVFEKLPQELVNVPVAERSVAELDEVRSAVAEENAALEGRGRVLLRPSGTEPVIRVMAEAPTADEARAACSRLQGVLESVSTAVAR
jgi:phosphoglucosamine mutase